MIAQEKVDCYYCGARFGVGDPAADEHWRDCPEHPAREALDLAGALRGYVEEIKMAIKILNDPTEPEGVLNQCAKRLRELSRKIEETKGINNDSVG